MYFKANLYSVDRARLDEVKITCAAQSFRTCGDDKVIGVYAAEFHIPKCV